MGGWAREAQGAESQKVSGIKERKISSVVWDRDDDDRRWGCQRKSPPPTPDLLLYLKFKELASPIMGRGGGAVRAGLEPGNGLGASWTCLGVRAALG